MMYFWHMWEGIKWFFTFAASANKEGESAKRTDFQSVTQGYDKLQETLQKRIDSVTKDLQVERDARAITETKMNARFDIIREAGEARELVHRQRTERLNRQLMDCREREITVKASMESLQNELRETRESLVDARAEIKTLRKRMDDWDSDEHKRV